MIRNRILLRAFAVFFLIEMFCNAVAPAVSWALTSGPTAPEATSFEPVDTSEMVNLTSGDFVYNLPLIEVPGPGGGYPLSLSYHAGILLNEEASMVGLGFTLNPGSIARNVNGYADDAFNQQNVVRDYWSGGKSTSYTVGLNVGIANTPLSVGAGVTISQDTYQGTGVGVSFNVGMQEDEFGFNYSFGIDPYGGAYASPGISLGKFNASVSDAGVSVNYGNLTSVGADISSDGIKVHGSYVGLSAVSNTNSGRVSSKSRSYAVQIPIPYTYYSISLGYNYQRYWSDESLSVGTNGVLYSPKDEPESFANSAYDYHSMYQAVGPNLNPDFVPGGTIPSYDNYFVSAQGLGGSIRPFQYKGLSFTQNKKGKQFNDKLFNDNSYTIEQYRYNPTEYRNERLEFRFENDFSNQYYNTAGQVNIGTDDYSLSFNFYNKQQTGLHDNDGIINNRLVGSRHIEWYTNQEILGSERIKDEGFIDCQISDFDRLAAPTTAIGGFKITNTSGVTYHYALPVYSMNEVSYSENTSKEKGTTFNRLSRPNKYAYTWLLTAVTGSDYIDRNNNSLVDDGDWGYWVNFEYIKYASNYHWRTPGEDYLIDLDSEFKNYSSGEKELYYIENIRTATHVAHFVKSVRYDSREVTNSEEGGFELKDGDSKSSLKLDNIKLYQVTDFDAEHFDKTLKTIRFNYDYSLTPGTPNSFSTSNPTEKLGKLTLNSVQFFGQQGDVGLIPPIKFFYSDPDAPTDVHNPSYNREHYDNWNYFSRNGHAPDSNQDYPSDETQLRLEDPDYMDAWSLRVIENSLGSRIKVTYEADDYQTVVYGGNRISNLNAIKSPLIHQPNDNLFLYVNQRNMFNIGDEINITFLSYYTQYEYTTWLPLSYQSVILDITDDYLVVKGFISSDSWGHAEADKFVYNIMAGHVTNKNPKGLRFGGGIRVKNIDVITDQGISSTSYSYKSSDGKSSGVTSYEPFVFENSIRMQCEARVKHNNLNLNGTLDDAVAAYNEEFYKNFSDFMSYVGEYPAPGVVYGTVTVSGSYSSNLKPDISTTVPNKTVYEFLTSNSDLIKKSTRLVAMGTEFSWSDYTSRIGSLKRISTFNGDKLISQTETTYLHDESGDYSYSELLSNKFNNQGVIYETTMGAKVFTPYHPELWADMSVRTDALVTRRVLYPTIITKKTTTDFLNNTSTVIENIAYDFYSGMATKVVSTDSYGNRFLTETVPAYVHYPAMGSKTYSDTNKNMLDQVAENNVYLFNGNTATGLVSASIQTWSDQTQVLGLTDGQPGIWRKSAIYNWSGSADLVNGLTPYSNFNSNRFSNWDSNGISNSENWEKVEDVSLYDINSHPLEASDINNNFGSSRFNPAQNLLIASAKNSKYSEMAYSGAEYYLGNDALEGGVSRGNGFASKAHAHTGTYSLMVGTGNVGFSYPLYSATSDFEKKYRASVWVYIPGDAETQADLNRLELYYSINGIEQKAIHPVFQKNKSKSWYLLNLDVDPRSAAGTVVISVRNKTQRSVYFDDFRIHPLNGSLNAYVYDPLTWQVTHILDGNNFYTKFDYDKMGRLIRTSKEQLNFDYGDGKESFKADAIVKEFKYNFGKGN